MSLVQPGNQTTAEAEMGLSRPSARMRSELRSPRQMFLWGLSSCCPTADPKQQATLVGTGTESTAQALPPATQKTERQHTESFRHDWLRIRAIWGLSEQIGLSTLSQHWRLHCGHRNFQVVVFGLQDLQEQMEKDEVKLCIKTLTGHDIPRAELKKNTLISSFVVEICHPTWSF